MISMLVIEDDFILNGMMTEYFSQKDFDLSSAFSAKEFYEILSQKSFDVILTDMQLESRGSGEEILKHLKEINSSSITIVCTGHQDDLDKLKNLANLAYLKPVNLDQILEDLEELLDH